MPLPPLDIWRERVNILRNNRGLYRFAFRLSAEEKAMQGVLRDLDDLIKEWNRLPYEEWVLWEEIYKTASEGEKNAILVGTVPSGLNIVEQYGASATKRHSFEASMMLKKGEDRDNALSLEEDARSKIVRVLMEYPAQVQATGGVIVGESSEGKEGRFYNLLRFALNNLLNAQHFRDMRNRSAISGNEELMWEMLRSHAPENLPNLHQIFKTKRMKKLLNEEVGRPRTLSSPIRAGRTVRFLSQGDPDE